MNSRYNFEVKKLGEALIESPLRLSRESDDYVANYVSDDQRIIYNLHARPGQEFSFANSELLERAGPRERIYFKPEEVKAAIVTCGGLCPGLNDVIRSIVMTLWYGYGVRCIYGIQYGYRGFLPRYHLPVLDLNPERVMDIHRIGGTILGASRGMGDKVTDIADAIESMNIKMLFTIGGDGTQRGSLEISEELLKRGLPISVVGIPKTIDNDLSFIERSFGFETAVSTAVHAVTSAHTEARNAINGIGIVKLMGRESGFIAAHTALAENDVNYVLIPEVPFELEGPNGLLVHVKQRLQTRNHAVILVAEGAGQNLLEASNKTDLSGNKKLNDIGLFLKQNIESYFAAEQMEINLKYIDPSYIIRSTPANPSDSIYCARLGTNAVHAAMAGKTQLLIGLVNNHMVYIPTHTAISRRNRVDPESSLWRDVVGATGQPALMVNKKPV